jgi:hypothetical protein
MPLPRRRFATALAISPLVAAMGGWAIAQDHQPTDIASLPGVVSWFGRIYRPQPEVWDILAEDPDADLDTFAMTINASIVAFDSAANAAAGFVQISSDPADVMVDPLPVDEAPFGDASVFFTGIFTNEGERIAGGRLVALTDALVVMVNAVSLREDDPDLVSAVDGFATYITQATPGEGDVDFNEDGASTGGTMDMLPTDDDVDVLNGLYVLMDQDNLAG